MSHFHSYTPISAASQNYPDLISKCHLSSVPVPRASRPRVIVLIGIDATHRAAQRRCSALIWASFSRQSPNYTRIRGAENSPEALNRAISSKNLFSPLLTGSRPIASPLLSPKAKASVRALLVRSSRAAPLPTEPPAPQLTRTGVLVLHSIQFRAVPFRCVAFPEPSASVTSDPL